MDYEDLQAGEAAMDDLDLDHQAMAHLHMALDKMKEFKPNDRSDLDRKVAISITEVEKTIAYFGWHVTSREEVEK